MKSLILAISVFSFVILSTGCKKCYDCTKQETLIVKGEEVNASANVEVCSKKDKKEVEGDGFVCVKK